MRFTVRHFLISWGVFNLIPLFFSNDQVEKIWYGHRFVSFTRFWIDGYYLDYWFRGICGYVNTAYIILFVMCLIGIYKTIKRGTII